MIKSVLLIMLLLLLTSIKTGRTKTYPFHCGVAFEHKINALSSEKGSIFMISDTDSLPFFPEDIILINSFVGFQKQNGIVYYFQGPMPIYQHDENDIKSFRLFTSQLVINGNAKQSEIVKAFDVTPISVKRWVKIYR